MAELGKAYVEVRADTSAFSKDITKMSKDVASDAGGNLSKAFAGFGKAAAASFATALAVGVAAGVSGIRASISAASDLGEAENVSQLVFGDAQAEVQKFAEAANEFAGLSDTAALQATSSFGGLLRNLQFGQEETVKWSQDLTVLAADMGSAFNTDTEEAIMAISAGLRGESEQLKKFNVFLSETDVKTEAVRLGLIRQGEALTNNEKAQARLSLIMTQTNLVSGDFANTLGESLPNQMKVLQSSITDGAAAIGEEFLPLALEVVKWANDNLPAALDVVVPVMRDAADAVRGMGIAAQEANDWVKQFSDDGITGLAKATLEQNVHVKAAGKLLGFFADKGKEARIEIERQANLVPSAKAAYEELAGSINAVDVDPVEDLRSETEKAADKAKILEEAWSGLFDLFGDASSLDEARQDLIEMQREIDEMVADGASNTGIGLGTEQTEENREAVRDLAGEYVDLSQRMLDNGASVGEVNTQLAMQRQAAIDTAVAFGASEEAATEYIDETLKFPTELHTDVTVDDNGSIARTQRELDAIEARKLFVEMVITGGGDPYRNSSEWYSGNNHTGGFSNREHVTKLDRDEWVVSSRSDNQNQQTRNVRNSRGETLDDVLGNTGTPTVVNNNFITPNFDERTLARFASEMMMEGAGV